MELTKEEFIKAYCEGSNITEEELLEGHVILPCSCDYEGCKGWAAVGNNPLSIEAHNE